MAASLRFAQGGKGGPQAKSARLPLLQAEEQPRPPSKPPPGKPVAQGSAAASAPGGSAPCRGQVAAAASAPQIRAGTTQALRPLARLETPPQKRARTEPEAPAVPTLTVISTDPRDELGIQPLICGDYVPEGSNHGRPAFRKLGNSKHDVRLYYWDERDGADYSGWYFGDKVGGNEVWLLNRNHDAMPPRSGWTWREGEVRDELMVLTADEKAQLDAEYSGEQQWEEAEEAEMGEEAQEAEEAEEVEGVEGVFGEEDPQDEWAARVQQASARLEAVETETAQVLEAARLAVEAEMGPTVEGIERAQELLMTQTHPIQEAQRIAVSEGLTRADAPGHVKTAAVELMQRVRALTSNVKAAEKRLAEARAECEKRQKEDEIKEREAARARELEAKHSAQLEELLRTSMEKVNSVEDEVERVEIAATPLEMDPGDGLQSVMQQAVKEVEQLAKAANLALTEGRRVVTMKVTAGKRLLQGMKSSVVDELTAQLEKLNELQNKLKPFGFVRQTFEQKMHARKVLDEVSEKLAVVELDVERAVMACSPVSGESCRTAKQAELALNKARTALSQMSMTVEAKIKAVAKTKGPLVEGLEEVQVRVKQMEERLKESQQALKDMKNRAAADALMHEISTKAETIEVELQKLTDVDTLLVPLEDGELGPEADSVVAEVEKASTAAQSALATGEAYVKKMQSDLSKVSKESKDSSEVVNEAISHLQTRLDEGKERLKQFAGRVAGIRRKQLIQKVEVAVADAEADIQRLAAITATFNEGDQGEEEGEGLKESLQQAIQAEKGVQSSIVFARKSIVDISSELRKLSGAGPAVTPEIAKLQQRMSLAQQEALRLRNAAKTAEERVKARAVLKDIAEKVQAAEEEAASVAAAANAAETEDSAADAAEVEKLATKARAQHASLKKLVAMRMKAAKPGAVKDMLGGLDARLQDCEAKLGGASSSLQARKHRQKVAELVLQATQRVEQVEAEVHKTGEAELPFLTGLEELPGDTAHSALKNCEAAASRASQVLTEARSVVASSLVDAKRLSGEAWDSEEITALEQRLGEAASKLSALQEDTAERRRSLHQQIASERVSNAEDAVQKLTSALAKFTEDKLDTEEAHAVCEELAAAEKEASQALASAKDFLTEQMKQIKSGGDPRALTADIAKWQSKLRQHQVAFARLSRESQTREQRFVAQQMLKELPDGLEKLEVRVETAHTAAAPLLSADKSTVLRDVRVQLISQSLRAALKGSDVEDLFEKITGGKLATKAELATFLDKLPGPKGAEGAPTGIPGLSGEQAASALVQAAGEGEGLSIVGLQRLLCERLVCKARTAGTDSFEGGKEVTIIEVGEIVEVQAQREAAGGGTRMQCVLSRDQTSVWVWLQGASSSVLFEPSESTSGRVESIVALVEGVCARCVEVAKDAEQKAQMCEAEGGQQAGPLAEARPALQKLKMKANVLQVKMEQLRKRVQTAKTALLQKWEAAQAQAQQLACKAMLEQQLKDAATAVECAENKATQVLDGVKAGKVFKASQEGSQTLDSVKQSSDEALTALAEAKVVTSRALGAHKATKGSNKNAVLDAQVQLMKLMSRVTSMERKCRMAAEVVTQAERKYTEQARSVLRATVQKLRKTSDELFDEFADGGEELSDAQLALLVESLPDMGMDKAKAIAAVRLGVPESRGLRRSELADVVQEFRICAKNVTMTDSAEIERPGGKKAKLMRMLDDGEFFQVLEGPREEAEAAAGAPAPMRLRGRALRDGTEGWVTVTGNRGTVFLQPARKPYMRCVVESVKLREAMAEASAGTGEAEQGELLELLEGPREDAVKPQTLLHGKASSDGAQGWMTFRELSGEKTAEPNEDVHICKTAIAMTDIFDIESCGIVRKINVGELLTAVKDAEAPAHTEGAGGVTRRRFCAMRDGATGWVSVMGSQGTVYLQVSDSHFRLNRRTPLHRGRDAAEQGGADDGGGAVVRWLEPGEVFEAVGPPQEGTPQAPRVSVRVRSASRSGVEGWASWSKSSEAPLRLHAPSS